ncbi:nucleotidyltransferase family protein [Polaribacter pectinis]|uniref:Nucleotidyltransferase family protein n=1 Tax=Polaribacter pectinis TaxID=2738844 RepID=A0A7G9L7P6_9FLAO|nr:nucleotidyltransferase family protein [Polaribacter pectinis]QNM84645.1 nucleotidyltransferase family protein [Polaribacter pectinis]
MKNIAVLVLAAGKSSRMKAIKQLVKINGKTLLDITLEKAKSVFPNDVFCVLGGNSDKIKNEITTKNITFINNAGFKRGLSSSIVTGIEFLKKNNFNYNVIFILLADQPCIEIEYLKSMVRLYKESPSKIVASNYKTKYGVPAIFPEKFFSELLLIEEDKGAKELMNNKNNDVICSEFKTNLIDIDTEEDLILFKKSISK